MIDHHCIIAPLPFPIPLFITLPCCLISNIQWLHLKKIILSVELLPIPDTFLGLQVGIILEPVTSLKLEWIFSKLYPTIGSDPEIISVFIEHKGFSCMEKLFYQCLKTIKSSGERYMIFSCLQMAMHTHSII